MLEVAADPRPSPVSLLALFEGAEDGAQIDVRKGCADYPAKGRFESEPANEVLVELPEDAQYPGWPENQDVVVIRDRRLQLKEGALLNNDLRIVDINRDGQFMVLRRDDGSPLIARSTLSQLQAAGLRFYSNCRLSFRPSAFVFRKYSTAMLRHSLCRNIYPCRPGSNCSQRMCAPPAVQLADQRWNENKLWAPESSGALGSINSGNTDRRPVVAVIDSGIDYRDSRLAGHMWKNPAETVDFQDNDANGHVDDVYGTAFITPDSCFSSAPGYNCDPADYFGHGTFVASVIVAYDSSRIMPLRVGTFSAAFSQAQILAAIGYACRHKADVINMSLGWGFSNVNLLRKAMRLCDRLFVIAAGNIILDGPVALNLPNLIAVAPIPPHACTEAADIAGAYPYDSNEVEILAPGIDICGFGKLCGIAYECPGEGSSYAAPQVAAAAALVMRQYPAWSAATVRSKLLANARPGTGSISNASISGGSLDVSFLAAPKCGC